MDLKVALLNGLEGSALECVTKGIYMVTGVYCLTRLLQSYIHNDSHAQKDHDL